MMLLEDQGKQLLREFGITVPNGSTITDPLQIGSVEQPVMIKALVQAGGRGKAGGVGRGASVEEVRSEVLRILGMSISGLPVRSVLVEEMLAMKRELYLSILVDRSSGLPLLLASGNGGMDVESLPEGSIGRWTVHPFLGVQPHLIRDVSRVLGLIGQEERVAALLKALWSLFRTMDCELVEINPLIITEEGDLVAADAKVTVNDDALFRHPELQQFELRQGDLEEEAREEGIAFVRLDGDIGVIANGAGLTMATLDELVLNGGTGGAFLDLGGTDDPAKVEKAFEIMVKAGPKVVLVNIFGGITKCDTVAEGVIRAVDDLKVSFPIVVRIRGVNEDKARVMLRSKGIAAHIDLEEAVREAVRMGDSHDH